MQYKESQKFNQWWLWIINLISLAVTVWGAYAMYTDGDFSWWTAATVALVVGIFVTMALVELRTSITEEGVEVRFWPLTRRRIFRSEIKSMHVRKYSPIGEYGGWGYRTSMSNGVAYNMMGDQGLQLELNNGKKILIGTQRPEELKAFLERYFNEYDMLTDEAVSLKLKELREEKLGR